MKWQVRKDYIVETMCSVSMRTGKPRREVDERAIIKQYMDGRKVREIIDEFCLSGSFLHTILKRNGIEVRKRIGCSVPKKLSDELVQGCWKQVCEGKSLGAVAKDEGISITGLSKALARRGLRDVRGFEKKALNDGFFDVIDSEEKAYWLGFFYADGNILDKWNVVQISLQERDAVHLQKFADCLSFGPVVMRNRGVKGVEAQIYFKNKRLWEGLKGCGIVPRKSLVCVLPEGVVPEWLERHFWRGYVDGDGTIPVSFRYGKSRDSLEIIGSKGMCDGFSGYVDKMIGEKSAVIVAGTVYKVVLTGVVAKRMMGMLYNDAMVFLERKKLLSDGRMIVQGADGVVLIKHDVAGEFMRQYHYLGGVPIGVRSYGWFEGGLLMGVAAVGSPSGPNVWRIVDGAAVEEVGELRRFVLADDAHGKNNASKFLAKVLRLEKKVGRYKYLVSYADSAQGHTGTIYKAVGARCVGYGGNELVAVDGGGRRYSGRAIEALIDSGTVEGWKFGVSCGKLRFVFDL